MESAQQREFLRSFKASLIAQYGHCGRHPLATPKSAAANQKPLVPNPAVPIDSTETTIPGGLNQNQRPQTPTPTPTPAPAQRIGSPKVISDNFQEPATRGAQLQKSATQNDPAQKPVAREQGKKRFSFLRKSKTQESSPSPTAPINRTSSVPATQTGSYEVQSQKSPVNQERTAKLRSKYSDVVRILEKNGFRVGTPDFNKGEALIWAAGNGDEAVARCLILEYSFSDEFIKMDALSAAAKGGHTAIITIFLELNFVDPKRKYCYFRTDPLHEVVRFGDERSVQAILDGGANIKAICQRGQSALHEAAAYGNTSAVRLLVKSGAPLFDVDSNRYTALHLAAGHGHSDVVKILLESGIDRQETSLQGSTALHLATMSGFLEVVKLLLEGNAYLYVNPVDDAGKTPVNYAIEAGNQELVDLLMSNGGIPSEKSHQDVPTPNGQGLEIFTPGGRGLEIFGVDGKDFLWDPDKGLEPIKKRTSDQHHATGFDYEPGYFDEVY